MNCDEAEQVGAKIHKKLDNVSVVDASIKRSDQVLSLDFLQPGIQVEKKEVNIDPTILFVGWRSQATENLDWLDR